MQSDQESSSCSNSDLQERSIEQNIKVEEKEELRKLSLCPKSTQEDSTERVAVS